MQKLFILSVNNHQSQFQLTKTPQIHRERQIYHRPIHFLNEHTHTHTHTHTQKYLYIYIYID